MNLTDRHISVIEHCLDIKLYDNQVRYLKGIGHLGSDRASGKTLAYCIKLALSDGPPIDLGRIDKYSDRAYYRGNHSYSRQHFKPEFMHIRSQLSKCGLKVRDVIN